MQDIRNYRQPIYEFAAYPNPSWRYCYTISSTGLQQRYHLAIKGIWEEIGIFPSFRGMASEMDRRIKREDRGSGRQPGESAA